MSFTNIIPNSCRGNEYCLLFQTLLAFAVVKSMIMAWLVLKIVIQRGNIDLVLQFFSFDYTGFASYEVSVAVALSTGETLIIFLRQMLARPLLGRVQYNLKRGRMLIFVAFLLV